MKPIKDCGWVEPDGTCGLPSNLTPECHIDACPRLAPFVSDLLAACEAALEMAEHLESTFGAIHGDLGLVIETLQEAIAKSKGE